MERRAELALIRRLFAHLDAKTTDEATAPLALAPALHTSPAHLERERRALFRGQPIAVALSADLPTAGSFLALASGGVPLLLIRGRDERVRAFVNVCRHRGAPLAEGRGHLEGGRLRCPFHAWTYELDGRLAAIPLGEEGHRDAIGTTDARDATAPHPLLGLLERPCGEAHGLVLVRPEGNAAIGVADWLGEVGADLDALGLRDFHFFAAQSSTWRANWKLLLETFLESLHVFSLHRESVHPHYFSLPMVADRLGPHLRFPVARRSLAALREEPESAWRLVDHATVQWYLAPNALLSATRDYALLWRFESPSPDVCLVETRFYTRHPVADEKARRRFDDAFALQLRVTGAEDFPMQEKIQANLASGAAADLAIGAHEIGVVHFHTTLAALIAAFEGAEHP